MKNESWKDKYDLIWYFHPNGFAIVKLNKKEGLVNEKGEEVIPPKYDLIWYFHPNGFAIVKLNKKEGLINSKGEVKVPIIFDDMRYIDKNHYKGFKNGEEIDIDINKLKELKMDLMRFI